MKKNKNTSSLECKPRHIEMEVPSRALAAFQGHSVALDLGVFLCKASDWTGRIEGPQVRVL